MHCFHIGMTPGTSASITGSTVVPSPTPTTSPVSSPTLWPILFAPLAVVLLVLLIVAVAAILYRKRRRNVKRKLGLNKESPEDERTERIYAGWLSTYKEIT